MKRSTQIGIGLATAITAVNGFRFYDQMKFDCSQPPDPELASTLRDLKACLSSQGLPGPAGTTQLTFEDGGNTSVIRLARNLFGQEGLITTQAGRAYKDECFDGDLRTADELFVREDLRPANQTGGELLAQENPRYHAQLQRFNEICEAAQKEVPPENYNCLAPAALHLSDQAPQLYSSVVEIFGENGSACTGFFVDLDGKRFVATAAHCVVEDPMCIGDSQGKNCSELKVVTVAWPSKHEGRAIESFYFTIGLPISPLSMGETTDFSLKEDIAVLVLPEDLSLHTSTPLPFSELSVSQAPYWTLGHGNTVTYSTLGFDAAKKEEERIHLLGSPNCRLIPGYSGGPLLDQGRNVLGVMSQGKSVEDNTETYATPIGILTEWAKTPQFWNLVENRARIYDTAKPTYQSVHETSNTDQGKVVLTPEGYKIGVTPITRFQ